MCLIIVISVKLKIANVSSQKGKYQMRKTQNNFCRKVLVALLLSSWVVLTSSVDACDDDGTGSLSVFLYDFHYFVSTSYSVSPLVEPTDDLVEEVLVSGPDFSGDVSSLSSKGFPLSPFVYDLSYPCWDVFWLYGDVRSGSFAFRDPYGSLYM